MNIAQVFANAVVRRIAYVLVAAVLAWCGLGEARAQTTMCTASAPCSQGVAYSMCYGEGLQQLKADWPAANYNHRNEQCYESNTGTHAQGGPMKAYRPRMERQSKPSGTWTQVIGQREYWYLLSQACENGPDPESPTGCKPTTQECLARNSGLSAGNTSRNFAVRCIASCVLKATGPVVGVDGLYAGQFQYSGDVCTAGPTTPAGTDDDAKRRPPQECAPASGGMTFCLKPDGQHCYTSSNGRQNCWAPGETGEKDDGPVKQKRDAGTEAVPPNLQLPSGDNLQQSTTPKTQTTTVTNNNTTTTITTTTTNYTTQHGTNAGSKNSGESNTGDGSGKEGDKDQDGTASGGGDCKTPPVVTGDQVLGMVATQAWHTRCAVEAGNAAKVTGDVGDCKQPFTVEGTHANAVQLRAMRAQICNGDKNGDGQPDWTKPDGTEAGEGGEDDEPGMLARMVNTDMLDTGGFLGGGGQCPQLGTIEFGPFGEFNLDSQPYFCDLIALMRGVVLLMGVFLSLRILTGDVL